MAANRADPEILKAIFSFAAESLRGVEIGSASGEIAALEAAIADKLEECERIAEAVARTKGKVQAFVNKSIALADEVEKLQQEVAELAEEQAMREEGGKFGTDFLTDTMAYLYVPDDDTAKEKRAELHLKLARIVDTIWIWAYDLALIRFKDYRFGDNIHPGLFIVSLPHKQLPSRANPDAKYHKPPKPRPKADKPFFVAAMDGVLDPPEPRRAISLGEKLKPLLLEYAEESDKEEESDGEEYESV